MVLNMEHRKDFGKIGWIKKVGLIKQFLMVVFSGILDTGWADDRKMMKDKLINGKKL